MSIAAQENTLFDEWSKDMVVFVRDGVVDEEKYLASKPRIMFLAKETNAQERTPKSWDMRPWLRDDCKRGQTFDNVVRWIRGSRELPGEIEWSKLAKVEEAARRDALQSIAWVNVKKTPGGHTAVKDEIASASARDTAFLKRQFALYDPDIAICCGVDIKDAYKKYINPDANHKWPMTTRGIAYFEREPEKFVISYPHPESRVKDCLLHYGLVDAVKEINSRRIHR